MSTANFPSHVTLVEVGARDGLQNLAQCLSYEIRSELINKLVATGLQRVEAGSFVSKQAVPQMADTDKVFANIQRQPGIKYSALVPNLRGLEAAIKAGANEIAVFVSASDGFSKKNINCSIIESLKRLEPVMIEARAHNIPVRGYVSCVMGCPIDGVVQPSSVTDIANDLLQMGCYEISLGDTIGVGTPLQSKRILESVTGKIPIQSLAAHFHNTFGQALVNLYAVIEEGLSVVDTSIAGLGGCPYAPGASGNAATEDVLYMLSGMGIETGVNIHSALEVALYICAQLGIASQSSVGLANKSMANRFLK